MNTKSLGDQAENKALEYLLELGYILKERNFRFKRSEIDLILEKDGVIHFVEVKYRKNDQFGNPEDFVDQKKLEMIEMGAEGYIEQLNWEGDLQFDIVAITDQDLLYLEDIW